MAVIGADPFAAGSAKTARLTVSNPNPIPLTVRPSLLLGMGFYPGVAADVPGNGSAVWTFAVTLPSSPDSYAVSINLNWNGQNDILRAGNITVT